MSTQGAKIAGGSRRIEWFKDESFWASTFPEMFDPARLVAAARTPARS